MFRIFIPGVGNVFVQAGNANEAVQAALRYVNNYNLGSQVNPADLDNLQATPYSQGSLQQGYTIIDGSGKVTTPGTTAPGEATRPSNPLIPGVGDTVMRPGELVPATPITSPPGGGGGGPSDLDTPNSSPGPEAIAEQTQIEREVAAPDAAFRAWLKQQGAPTGGVLGGILQSAGSAAPRLFSLQGARESMGSGGVQESSLTDFFNSAIGGQGVTRGLGQNALQNLRSLSTIGAGGGNAVTDPFLNPDSFDTEGARDVRTAGRSALTGRNAFLGSRFGSQIDDALQNRFQDSVFKGQQSPNFAQWVLQNLGF